MKKNLLFAIAIIFSVTLSAQYVGINTTAPKTSLQIDAKNLTTSISGLVIPRLTGDEIYNMPITTGVDLEANLVYAKSAASVANQTGKGENLKGKGFFYWDGSAWVSIDTNATTVNNIWSQIKPMNILLSDQDSYPSSGTGITSPSGTNLKLFTCNYSAAETMKSDPLNFTMWDNSTNKIKVPAQLKGYTITVNISLKYPAQASNAGSTRFAAYTGNATLSGGLYVSGGTKLKDLYFKLSKVNTGGTVRDELVLSPIIVTQDIIDHGIYLFLGASDVSFYEPILTIDYGVVNTGLN